MLKYGNSKSVDNVHCGTITEHPKLVRLQKEMAEVLIQFCFKLVAALSEDEQHISAPSQMEAKVDHICELLEEVMGQAQDTAEMFNSNSMTSVLLSPETFVLLDNIQLLNREVVNITNFLYGVRVESTDKKVSI